jgi:adenosylhomocysteinase
MKMLAAIRAEFERARPFSDRTIGICLHIEPKTAVLCRVLKAGGAKLALTGSPGTTQDDVAAALTDEGVLVYGRRSDGASEHARNVESVLGHRPDLLLDNGADLVAGILETGDGAGILGATEETTTGANRLREDLKEIPFPVIVINDSPLKRIVENEHGVGQSVVAAFQNVTNSMIPGRRFVVIGYGWCGRGIARTLKVLGARVGVVETASVPALEAALDGMVVGSLEELLPWGSVFVTVTGRPGILTREHFASFPDGAILANAGHFRWEIEVDALRADAVLARTIDENVESFTFADGRTVALLAGGEMLNLAAGRGNPVETMDMGLSVQARSFELLVKGGMLVPGPQPVPESINDLVAKEMLRTFSV